MERGSTIRLDRLDPRIPPTLLTTRRIGNVDLAKPVGLSATPCRQRVRRFEAAGYIRGYDAPLDIDRIYSNLAAFTEIGLRDHRRADFLGFERRIDAISPILDCFLVAGGYDYPVQFIARDIHDDRTIVEGTPDRDLGVEKYFSDVTVKQVEHAQGYPLSKVVFPQDP